MLHGLRLRLTGSGKRLTSIEVDAAWARQRYIRAEELPAG